jgi:hypothetical protein
MTGAAIAVGGCWVAWRFYHSEWLRRRAELPCLEGNSSTPEISELGDNRVAVNLRWSWRNAGSRARSSRGVIFTVFDSGEKANGAYIPALGDLVAQGGDVAGAVDPST